MINLIENTHPQWHEILTEALSSVDQNYLRELSSQTQWLPGQHNIFNAFKHPLDSVNYILLGESPYPRAQSANGYAFWDNKVKNLWSDKGLSKEVNRATSLRNLIKMLLVARGDLQQDRSQEAIAKLKKTAYCQTGEQLFISLINKGFLLLNASLVYDEGLVPFHAKQWRPFMSSLFNQLARYNKSIQLILLGRIAAQVPEAKLFSCLIAEHPYNLSFISSTDVLSFFRPLDLLSCHDQ